MSQTPVNVLKMVKQKRKVKTGPKKQKTPAAKKVAKPRIWPITSRDEWVELNELPIAQLHEGINEYARIARRKPMQEFVIMNVLRYHMPWFLAKKFILDYVNSGSYSIEYIYEEFIRTDEFARAMATTKRLLEKRRAVPNKYSGFKELEPSKPHREMKPYEEESESTKEEEDEPSRRKAMFTKSPVLSECEKEYRRAPWMLEFIDVPVRGMAIKRTGGEYDAYTILEKVGNPQGEWYKASAKWYEMACEEGRPYLQDTVGYVLPDNKTVVVETKPMYDASLSKWTEMTNIEFDPVNSTSMYIAKIMLDENEYLSAGKVSSDAILASMEITDNQSLARNLSKILVFLTSLIKGSQIHIQRTKAGQYAPESFIQLDRYTTLPEIYKNPNAENETETMEQTIKKKRRAIEEDFYSRVKTFDPSGSRVRKLKAAPMVFNRPAVEMPTRCPVGTTDVVYYLENGRLFCFERLAILGKTVNPETGIPFSSEFLNEIRKLKDPVVAEAAQIGLPDQGPKKIEESDLAPGLFEKLRDEILLLTPVFCTECHTEIFIPKYKSSYKGKKIVFCGSECFEQFKF